MTYPPSDPLYRLLERINRINRLDTLFQRGALVLLEYGGAFALVSGIIRNQEYWGAIGAFCLSTASIFEYLIWKTTVNAKQVASENVMLRREIDKYLIDHPGLRRPWRDDY